MTGRCIALLAARRLIRVRACGSGQNDTLLYGFSRTVAATRTIQLPGPISPSCRRSYSIGEAAAEGTRKPRPRKPYRRLLVVGLFLTGTLIYFTGSSSSFAPAAATLNGTTFAPYTIVDRVAMSPSSFVLTVSPETPNPDPPYLLPSSNRWRHPLWSVEFKQPEVQISRHYTPLPPEFLSSLSSSSSSSSLPAEASAERDGCLRFYIRAIGEGEMSRYLNRLREGHTIWLRGPHVGFDLVKRLGASKSIVFLAGGTGVVPGMQAARVVLDGLEDSKVSLLWAVRNREEVQSKRVGSSSSSSSDQDEEKGEGERGPPERGWWDFRSPKTALMELDVRLSRPSPVAAQLARMKTQYGDRLSVQVVIDEEKTFFDKDHIQTSLSQLSPDNNGAKIPSSDPTSSCSLHNQELHTQASEFENDSPVCRCSPTEGVLPGRNLFVVSGPEGFVRHYAGAKVWAGGRQTQGPVGGVVAALQDANPQLARDWLVLKL